MQDTAQAACKAEGAWLGHAQCRQKQRTEFAAQRDRGTAAVSK